MNACYMKLDYGLEICEIGFRVYGLEDYELGFRLKGLTYTENVIKISRKYVFELIYRFKKIQKW